jgi:hypothetical protein
MIPRSKHKVGLTNPVDILPSVSRTFPINVVAAIFKANVKRAIVGFAPLASNAV